MDDLSWCIDYLKSKNNIIGEIGLEKEKAFRALMNITMPHDLSEEFYKRQDKVLQDRIGGIDVVDVSSLEEVEPRISLFKGDITTLKADAIVDACNEKLLGCFVPLYGCIDNAIHSFAGLQVRRDLLKIMEERGHDEANGQVKVTKGYNLPSKYIFHTIGPKVHGKISEDNIIDLTNCYLSCLKGR